MVVGFGRTLPKGNLPVYSVADEEEAGALIVLTCPTNQAGQYIAPELAEAQTLDNLDRFSDRLDRGHDRLRESGNCRCA